MILLIKDRAAGVDGRRIEKAYLMDFTNTVFFVCWMQCEATCGNRNKNFNTGGLYAGIAEFKVNTMGEFI